MFHVFVDYYVSWYLLLILKDLYIVKNCLLICWIFGHDVLVFALNYGMFLCIKFKTLQFNLLCFCTVTGFFLTWVRFRRSYFSTVRVWKIASMFLFDLYFIAKTLYYLEFAMLEGVGQFNCSFPYWHLSSQIICE